MLYYSGGYFMSVSAILFKVTQRDSGWLPWAVGLLFNCLAIHPKTSSQIVSRGKKLTLNTPIATKVVCFSRLLKYLRSLYGKQCGPRSDCFYAPGPTLLASILNLSVTLGNYLQQTTSADDIFRCIFSWRFKG